ncbi:MAG: hypothetical protein V3S16_09825, partial [Candidatus Desulfatibia sp.]|uniref:hypothetical protein n=1 Tax=Candidatus Desulfatibia sp. TaxID=3101189 RepID=UPI002F2D79CA
RSGQDRTGFEQVEGGQKIKSRHDFMKRGAAASFSANMPIEGEVDGANSAIERTEAIAMQVVMEYEKAQRRQV